MAICIGVNWQFTGKIEMRFRKTKQNISSLERMSAVGLCTILLYFFVVPTIDSLCAGNYKLIQSAKSGMLAVIVSHLMKTLFGAF